MNPRTASPVRLAALVTTLSLAACGGGGSEPAAPVASPPPPAAIEVPAPAPAAETPAEPVAAAAPAAEEGPTAFAQATATDVTAATSGYYVDSQRGADTNDGSYDRPWRTLAKLSGARASASKPIFLRCDSTWRESLKLGSTQLAAGSVIQAYGACAASTAVISGADDVSGGWTLSSGVWSRNIGAGRNVTQLFVNGKAHRIARWPNAPASGDGYALTAVPATASTTAMTLKSADASTLSGRDLANAQLQVRTGGALSSQVLSSSLDVAKALLALASAAPQAIGGDAGYVLQNKRWMLDAPGEFFYDNASGELSVIASDAAVQANLNGALVEASVRDSAIEISYTSGVTVRGIGVVKVRQNGIRLYDAAATTLSSVTAMDNGRAGAAVITSSAGATGSSGSVVTSSVFVRNALYGVDASGTANVTLRNNTVKDTGMSAFIGQPMAGIWTGPGATVDGNTVQRSALTGIRFSGAGGTKITRNVVTDSCLRFADCGAIYSWNGPKRSNWASGQQSLVQGNVVARAPTNMTGAGTSAPDFNAGIYYDDFSAGATISGNWVFDLPIGIMLHNTANSTVSGNTVANASSAALWANMDDTGTDYMTGNVWSGNRIVPASYATGSFPATPVPKAAHAIWFWHKTLGSASITSGGNTFRDNHVVQVNDPAIPTVWFHGADGDRYLLGAAWTAFNPLDPLPSVPAQFALYLPVLGGELVPNGGFDAGLGAWTSWFATVNGTKGTLTGAALPGCSGTCARFAALSIHDTIISPAFSMTPGAMYQVSYTASFVTAGSASRPGFVGTTSNAGTVTGLTSTSVLNGIAGQTLAYTGVFTAASSEPSTLRLAASAGTTLGYDGVSVRQVTNFSTSKVNDWIGNAFAGATAASVTCASFGWPATCRLMDTDGVELAQPVALAAYSGRTFLRADSPWRTR